MNKIFLIIKREYLTRVRKRSFIVMTILGPLLFGGLASSVFLLDKADTEHHIIAVLDETHVFEGKFKNDERLTFISFNENLDSLRKHSSEKGLSGILYIPRPKDENMENLEKGITLYSQSNPGFETLQKIRSTIEKEVNAAKYIAAGIDEKKLSSIKTDIEIQTKDMTNKETSTGLTTGLGFGGGILIYFFIFLYGVQVMRGVMEEKTNRIVEVIASSVKPFQLMMGKIIGVGLVGLTQFLLWVILSGVIVSYVSSNFGHVKVSHHQVDGHSKTSTAFQPIEPDNDVAAAAQSKSMNKFSFFVESINYPVIFFSFLFFFLGGYLLYSALFAAVGSAVEVDTDTQQFMLPITIPLILAYIASISVINNPDGALAFWFSIIPLTSPIVMMVRIPFGVPYWQIGLSMTLLVLGFIFTTWLAGKIYRVGILMYGKKVSYRELAKWIRYKN